MKALVIRAYAALSLSVAMVVWILVVAFHRILLRPIGSYSAREKTVYSTLSTVLASAMTAFSVSTLQALFIALINHEFQRKGEGGRISAKLNRRWRTVLYVAGPREAASNWHVVATYLVTGLMTASLVASVTPSVTEVVHVDGQVLVSSGGLPSAGKGAVMDCVAMRGSQDEVADDEITWGQMKNGSLLGIRPEINNCPTQRATEAMLGINAANPVLYAYVDDGVTIDKLAMGASSQLYSQIRMFADKYYQPRAISHTDDRVCRPGNTPCGLNVLLDSVGVSNLLRTEACVPVIYKNPVKCRAGGTFVRGEGIYSDGGWIKTYAGSTDQRFMVQVLQPGFGNKTYDAGNTASDNATVVNSVMEPGTATYFVAGTADVGATIAMALGDTSRGLNVSATDFNTTNAATCIIDARDVFKLRRVRLSLQRSKPAHDLTPNPYGWQLDADDSKPCNGPGFEPGQILAAQTLAAFAAWDATTDNSHTDGWWQSINRVAISYGSDANAAASPRDKFAFRESQNGLEDVLGVTSALVVAHMNSNPRAVDLAAYVVGTRIGPGETWTAIYALPSLFTAVVLVILLQRFLALERRYHKLASVASLREYDDDDNDDDMVDSRSHRRLVSTDDLRLWTVAHEILYEDRGRDDKISLIDRGASRSRGDPLTASLVQHERK